MASSSVKETPKKQYTRTKSVTTESSSCRLCKSVVDRRHSKDLFGLVNRAILANAEIIYGKTLRQDDALPHLICRPCERRVNNFITFKKLVEDTQRSLEDNVVTKRCLEISPSLPQPASVRARGQGQGQARQGDGARRPPRRRSLEFEDSPSAVSN